MTATASMVRALDYRSRGPGLDSRGTTKKSSGSGTGSTQPREYNWGAAWKKSSGYCLENREYGRRDPSRWPRGSLYPQKLAITSSTSCGRSVGIVRSRTQTMEFFCYFLNTAWSWRNISLPWGYNQSWEYNRHVLRGGSYSYIIMRH
jgi:hypothetical protein